MIKNAIIHTFEVSESAITQDALESALQGSAFVPCGPTQQKSVGWVPVRGKEHGALVESASGWRVLSLSIETKSVPKLAVDRVLNERLAKIEQQEGRKPGRKKVRDMREEIVIDLLPHAFPKTASITAWIDPERKLLIVDSSSQNKADEVVTALTRAVPGMKIGLLDTKVEPQAAMTQWLTLGEDERPNGFGLGQFVELHSGDEMKSVVKFDRHHLDDEQMRLHIGQGKLPTKLALDWMGRVSFVLTEGMQIRKIAFLDAGKSDGEDSFDSDAAVVTAEIGELIDYLMLALGGPAEGGAA